MPDHKTGNFMPYSLRIVCGFLNIPQLFKGCERGPPAYSPYPRRLESLTICWCNYKGSTFYSVILRPWVLVRPESNSRPPTSQSNAQQLSHQFAIMLFVFFPRGYLFTAAHMLYTPGSHSKLGMIIFLTFKRNSHCGIFLNVFLFPGIRSIERTLMHYITFSDQNAWDY